MEENQKKKEEKQKNRKKFFKIAVGMLVAASIGYALGNKTVREKIINGAKSVFGKKGTDKPSTTTPEHIGNKKPAHGYGYYNKLDKFRSINVSK